MSGTGVRFSRATLFVSVSAVGLLLLGGAAVLAPRADAQVLAVLRREERSPNPIDVAKSGSPLKIERVRWTQVALAFDASRARADVAGVADWEGEWQGAAVSALGAETATFVRRGWSWTLEGPLLRRSQKLLQWVERERLAQEGVRGADGPGCDAPSAPLWEDALPGLRVRVQEILARLERDGATVRATFFVSGTTSSRPLETSVVRSFQLKRVGEEFCLVK